MKYLAYKDVKLPVAERVKDLLARMTLREKVGQLNQVFTGHSAYTCTDGVIELLPEFKKTLDDGMAGAVYGMHRNRCTENGIGRRITATEGVTAINIIQKYAVSKSRWGIPLLISEEAPKGFCAYHATIFPSPICYASSWDRGLAKSIGAASGKEIRAGGGHLGYGPILDICNDPRWSRIEEIFGEDPYLAGEMGAAMVNGMQNDINLRNKPDITSEDGGFSDSEAVMSTLKHFVAYGMTEGGRNTAPSHLGERELREIHIAPFKRALQEGAESVMCSYNEIDGIPVSASKFILTDILRGELGFEGFVVSDALAIDELNAGNAENIKHRIAPTPAGAATEAIKAGVDISLWDKAYLYLENEVNEGNLDIAQIDKSVSLILRAKFLLGLFERYTSDADKAETVLGCPEHKRLSSRAAEESIILLKNNGILPLNKSTNIAVTGPSAHNISNMTGTYTMDIESTEGVTVFDGIKSFADKTASVTYSLGCRIKDKSLDYLEAAIATAEKADVIIAAVGGSSKQSSGIILNENGQIDIDANCENDIDCGENIDRATLNLAGIQMDFLKALKATGKPLIVILIQGRPYDTEWIDENADAIINAWYPGQFGGSAIAKIIFGDINPSGKLTFSFPKNIGQIPVNYNHKPSAEKRYIDYDNTPLYKFGFGLSYTKYEYYDLSVTPTGDYDFPVEVSVKVKNTGAMDGDEIVQIYVRDEWASVTRNIRDLKGFERISLKSGQTKTVYLKLSRDAFSLYDRNMNYVLEPGEFTIYAGGDSDNLLSQTIIL